MDKRMDMAGALAANLVELRRSRGYSQQVLADLAELPRSTLAHMESGSGNPSLTNLARVAGALQVSLEELLARPRSACSLVKATDLPVSTGQGGAIRVRNLLPEPVKGLEIVRLQLDAGASRTGRPHLRGTKEYLHGLSGAISLLVAGQLYRVEAGDVLAFPGDQAHSYLNRETRPAEAISIVVPVPVGH